MPVFVLPADTELGLSLVRALRADGAQVHAYATGAGDVAALRATGAHVAVGDLDDVGRIESAMTGVHTVMAVQADPTWPDLDDLDTSLRTILSAAVGAEVQRVILRSVPGAAAGASDLLRHVCGTAEEAARDMDLPTFAVRTSLVRTTRLQDALASLPPRLRAATTPIAPMSVDDLVTGLVALDAARSTATSGHALFVAHGEVTTLADDLGEDDGMVGRTRLAPDEVPLLAPSLATSWVDDDPVAADLWELVRAGHE